MESSWPKRIGLRSLLFSQLPIIPQSMGVLRLVLVITVTPLVISVLTALNLAIAVVDVVVVVDVEAVAMEAAVADVMEVVVVVATVDPRPHGNTFILKTSIRRLILKAKFGSSAPNVFARLHRTRVSTISLIRLVGTSLATLLSLKIDFSLRCSSRKSLHRHYSHS
jgi:hypothetical protein